MGLCICMYVCIYDFTCTEANETSSEYKVVLVVTWEAFHIGVHNVRQQFYHQGNGQWVATLFSVIGPKPEQWRGDELAHAIRRHHPAKKISRGF